jgi:hypothetical protein
MLAKQFVPDLAIIVSNAEANLRLMPNPLLDQRLREVADTSDTHYFRLLIESVCMTEPVSLPGPVLPPPGSQWYWAVRNQRLGSIVSVLGDMRRVSVLTPRDLKKIYRQAGVPSRYRHNWQTCIDVAKFAVAVCDDPEFGSLACFFTRHISLSDGDRQVMLREAIRARCKSVPDASLDHFIGKAGLGRDASRWAVLALHRLGLITSDLSRPVDGEIRKDAVAVLAAMADASGRPYRYVQEVLQRGVGFSALWDLTARDSAICFHDLQRCDICRHQGYCRRTGCLEEGPNKRAGWLDLYPDYRRELAENVATFGVLPDTSVEAVLATIAFSNALWWRSEPVCVSASALRDIAASLACVPTDVLIERCRSRVAGCFAESANWYGYVTEAERSRAEDLASRNVPCILEQAFTFENPRENPVVPEAFLLLDTYWRQGRAEVPVLAVDWGSIGRIYQDRRMGGVARGT